MPSKNEMLSWRPWMEAYLRAVYLTGSTRTAVAAVDYSKSTVARYRNAIPVLDDLVKWAKQYRGLRKKKPWAEVWPGEVPRKLWERLPPQTAAQGDRAA